MLRPTDNLSNVLTELQFCTTQQLASFGPEVRRLAGDLPAFDSCWLDVLVAHRLLTPWQADCLQSDDPFLLRKTNYRLREPLGQRTWLAETFDRHRLVVLSRIADPDPQVAQSQAARARSIVAEVNEVRRFIPSSVCLPGEYLPDETGNGGWIVSPYIPGWQLAEIGGELLRALNVLQQYELNHGDIALRNVRLQPNGQPVLVDPFTARLLKPSIGFSEDLRLRDVQHCAPERAGSSQRNDVMSDLYSLGTILWQLLTARPTFISADPVTFLMQCREREVEDVRQWVPDCPDWLSDQIQLLTRRRPELRPQTVSAALGSWSTASGTRFPATRQLLDRLPDRTRTTVVPLPTYGRRRFLKFGWAAAALAAAVMMGLSSSLVPPTLNVRRTIATHRTIDSSAEARMDSEVPQVLPEISADGVIQLVGGQIYEARPLQHPGTIHIRTSDNTVALVEVPGQSSWKISSDQLRLEGIQVRFRSEQVDESRRVLDVRCRVLELDRTIIGDGTKHRNTALHWTSSAAGSSVVRVLNTAFLSGRYAIRTTSAPDRFVLRNVLFESPETAWRCDTSAARSMRLNMTQVTQRGGSSFADVLHGAATSRLDIDIVCGDSVLVPAQALVRLASTDRLWTPQNVSVAFRLAGRANPTIVLPSVNPVTWIDPSLNQTVALSEPQVLSESLLTAEPVFDLSFPSAASFANARLVDFDGPKRGRQLPGVDISQLPSPNTVSRNTEWD